MGRIEAENLFRVKNLFVAVAARVVPVVVLVRRSYRLLGIRKI
jgi:hypothetical protein